MAHRPARRPPAAPRYRSLADYIAATGDTQSNIARRVGTSQAHISRLVNGDRIPRALLALRLCAYAHIPLDSFTRIHLQKRARRVA
jgi:transcriptional regulator with XRE-family HTH domain